MWLMLANLPPLAGCVSFRRVQSILLVFTTVFVSISVYCKHCTALTVFAEMQSISQ